MSARGTRQGVYSGLCVLGPVHDAAPSPARQEEERASSRGSGGLWKGFLRGNDIPTEAGMGRGLRALD